MSLQSKWAGCSWRQFLRYVLPSVSAMLLFSLYTVVDGVIVSWGVGDFALTSVNIALPFVSFLSGISILLSMGTATLCSFALGSGDKKYAEELFSQTSALIVAFSAVVSVLVGLFAPQLAGLLGAGPETMADTTIYLRIVSIFAVCFILSYCMEVMVKVEDNPKMAVIGVGASFVTNVALDCLFVFGFHWGVFGAALATGLAQLVSLAIFLGYFLSKHSHMKFRRFRPSPAVFKRILPLGIPDCSIELVIGFLTILYNHILLTLFGEGSLRIYAVIAYANLFVYMIMQGVAQGMMHLSSFYVGKKEKAVANGYFFMSILVTVVVGVLAVALCLFAPHLIVGILLPADSAVFDATVSALRQFSLSFPLAGINIVIAGFLTAWEKPKQSVSLSLLRGFVFAPVALLLLAFLGGGQLLWFGALFGEVACLVLSIVLLRKSNVL